MKCDVLPLQPITKTPEMGGREKSCVQCSHCTSWEEEAGLFISFVRRTALDQLVVNLACTASGECPGLGFKLSDRCCGDGNDV